MQFLIGGHIVAVGFDDGVRRAAPLCRLKLLLQTFKAFLDLSKLTMQHNEMQLKHKKIRAAHSCRHLFSLHHNA